MKAKLELQFKEIPLEKAQKTLFDILYALKAIGMIEDGKFEILTPSGVVTENSLLQESRVVA